MSAPYTVDADGLHVSHGGGDSTAVLCRAPELSLDPTGPLTLDEAGDVLSEPTKRGTLKFVRVSSSE